jgi:hypothetical protein
MCAHPKCRTLGFRPRGGEAVELCLECDAVIVSTPQFLRTVYPMTMIPEVRAFLQEIVDHQWLLPVSDRRHEQAMHILEKYA